METELITFYKEFAQEMKAQGISEGAIRKAIIGFYDDQAFGEKMASAALN